MATFEEVKAMLGIANFEIIASSIWNKEAMFRVQFVAPARLLELDVAFAAANVNVVRRDFPYGEFYAEYIVQLEVPCPLAERCTLFYAVLERFRVLLHLDGSE